MIVAEGPAIAFLPTPSHKITQASHEHSSLVTKVAQMISQNVASCSESQHIRPNGHQSLRGQAALLDRYAADMFV